MPVQTSCRSGAGSDADLRSGQSIPRQGLPPRGAGPFFAKYGKGIKGRPSSGTKAALRVRARGTRAPEARRIHAQPDLCRSGRARGCRGRVPRRHAATGRFGSRLVCRARSLAREVVPSRRCVTKIKKRLNHGVHEGHEGPRVERGALRDLRVLRGEDVLFRDQVGKTST